MQTKTQISILITFFLTTIFGLQAQNTYHSDDKEALRAFLRQPSAVSGRCNIEQFYLLDTINWVSNEGWIEDIRGLTWNSDTPKKLIKIKWGRELSLSGELNLNPCILLTYLDIGDTKVDSLKIDSCIALDTLSCYRSQLTSLNLSGNTNLTFLSCFGNPLDSLDISANTNLTLLGCSGNQLRNLDISSNVNLTYLDCSNNEFSVLNTFSNINLGTLRCNNNQLATIDLSGNPNLTGLYCENNQLTALDVSNNTKLTSLICSNNLLTSLNVERDTLLLSLNCSSNQLSALDISRNFKLSNLVCSNNQITNLDISLNPDLYVLECENNLLTNLDASANMQLEIIMCNNNQIENIRLGIEAFLECQNNLLKFSALPKEDFFFDIFYAPQDTLQGGDIPYSRGIDLSAEYDIDGNITTFEWHDISTGTEQRVTLQNNNGIFSLDNSYIGKTLRCKMLNGYFPDFTSAQPLVYEVTITDGTNIPVTGISLDEHTFSLKVDSTETLLATITPNNATNQNKTWESRDENIATVNNNGLVTAISEGGIYIVVTTQDGNFQDSCLVTVTEDTDIAVTGVTLNKRTLSLKVDSTETLTATIIPNNATNQNKTWQSRDESIATVDNNGLVTGIDVGSTYIVVITADGGFQDSCLVSVEKNVGINDIENQATTFKIYPNPTSGKLIIENENPTTKTAELFDLAGKLLSTFKISNKKTEIEISRLPNGTYLIKLDNTSTKVVKQ